MDLARKNPAVNSCRNKRRYPDEMLAIASGLYAAEKSGDTLHTYRCPCCKGWHLTKRRKWDGEPLRRVN